MNTELALRSDVIQSLDDVQRVAKMFLATGYFDTKRQDAVGVAEIATKILAGRELGFKPFASVQGIYIIKGKPSIGGNLMASAVKGSEKYDYRVREKSTTACTIEFYERINGKWESLGTETFTAEEARKAGTQNMDKFPKNMLFNRCISNGVRTYCPDVFNGVSTYTPEEMGADVDENGEYIETTARVVVQQTGEIVEAETVTEPQRGLTSALRKRLHAVGSDLYGDQWDEKRAQLVEKVTKGVYTSSSDLTEEQAQRLIDGMIKKINERVTVEDAPAEERVTVENAEPMPF